MGGSGNPSPMPKPLGEYYASIIQPLLKQMSASIGSAGPGFGLNLNISPDVAEIAAQSAAMRTAGAADTLGTTLEQIGTLSGVADTSRVFGDIWNRQFDEGSAAILERFGTNTSAGALGVGRFGAQLGEQRALQELGYKERAFDRAINAALARGNLGGLVTQQLLGAGGALRGVTESNLNRTYQDIITRGYGLPLGIVNAATGAGSQQQYWQPTYGPSPWAGALGGAASGAMTGMAFGSPWLGALVGGLLGAVR